jgi:hypothetical protein
MFIRVTRSFAFSRETLQCSPFSLALPCSQCSPSPQRCPCPSSVTPGFKAKIICSSYVCPGSSCHTYGQNINTENQCLYYINIITRDVVFTQKNISTLSSSSSGTHQSHMQSAGGNVSSSSHLQLLSSVTVRVSRLMVATQQV